MKRAVGVVIFNQIGRVAIRQRLATTEGRHSGSWCGAGGMVEDGESFREAAAREFEEEGGVRLAASRFTPMHANEGHTGRFPYEVMHYLVVLESGETLTDAEGTEKESTWQWMTVDAVLALPLVPGLDEAVRRSVAHLSRAA